MRIYDQNVWNANPSAFRNALVAEMVAEFDADVCMLQEFGPETIRVGEAPLQKLLANTYSEVPTEKADRNFTPVFYKTDVYTLIDSGYVLYDGKNDADSKSVTWAVLEERATGKRVAVASTHFWWMYESDEDNRQRLKNADQLKKLCDTIVNKHGVPVIIGGDFNNGKNSVQGDEPYHYMCRLGFSDVRLSARSSTESPTCHNGYPFLQADGKTFTPGTMPECTIDYIFTYGEGLAPASFEVLTTPKARTSSDHCPLLSVIE